MLPIRVITTKGKGKDLETVKKVEARAYDAFKRWAWDSWEEFHNLKPTWTSVDFINLKKVWSLLGDSEARQVWVTFMRCDEKFHTSHSPRRLMADLDRFRLDNKKLNPGTKERGPDHVNSPMVEMIRAETQDIMEEMGLEFKAAFYEGVRRRNARRELT